MYAASILRDLCILDVHLISECHNAVRVRYKSVNHSFISNRTDLLLVAKMSWRMNSQSLRSPGDH